MPLNDRPSKSRFATSNVTSMPIGKFFSALGIAPLQWALIQIGVDVSIIQTLSSSPNLVTQQDLVQSTKAATSLLSHLLRSLAPLALINEIEKDTYTANRTTRIFANPHVIGAMPHLTDVHGPVTQALPLYSREYKYQNMNDSKKLPLHTALNTDLEPFEWMKCNDTQMKAMGHAMTLDAATSWICSYPVEREVGAFKPSDESALLVDIGGGFGQHAVAFKTAF